MRENRPYGSEGGEAKAFPTPIRATAQRLDCFVASLYAMTVHGRRSEPDRSPLRASCNVLGRRQARRRLENGAACATLEEAAWALANV